MRRLHLGIAALLVGIGACGDPQGGGQASATVTPVPSPSAGLTDAELVYCDRSPVAVGTAHQALGGRLRDRVTFRVNGRPADVELDAAVWGLSTANTTIDPAEVVRKWREVSPETYERACRAAFEAR